MFKALQQENEELKRRLGVRGGVGAAAGASDGRRGMLGSGGGSGGSGRHPSAFGGGGGPAQMVRAAFDCCWLCPSLGGASITARC